MLSRVLLGFFAALCTAAAQSATMEEAKVVEVSETRPAGLFVGDAGADAGKLQYETLKTQEYAVAREEKELKRLTSLEWLLNIYNPHRLADDRQLEANLQRGCAQDLTTYVQALELGEPWAAKMTDASGRYSSQFFFGNSFWLGSESLCQELGNVKLVTQPPPFGVGFSIAKISVRLSDVLTPKPRIIFLGLCLPASCSHNDTTAILTARGNFLGVNGTSLTVHSVRSVPGDYVIFKDVRFHLLGGAILLIALLLALGTLYECVLERKRSNSGHYASNTEAESERSKGDRNDLENNNSRKCTIDAKSGANVYEVTKSGREEKQDCAGAASHGSKREANSGVLAEVLMSFSVYSNGSKILNCDQASEDSLTSVHGLRFFSLAWVILVHTYLQLFAIGENKTIRAVTERSFMYQTIGNATFSVDSFFFISGLLVAYLFFKNEGGKTSDSDGEAKVVASKFFALVVYRFVRLTPVYIVVLGMIQLSMSFIHSSSVFEPTITDHVNCDNYWWRNILYVNNLFPRTEMCMLWSWYMATDTQFFVLSALLLLIAKKRFKFTVTAGLVVLLSSWCTTAVISYTHKYEARVQEPFALFDELYDKPWTRIGPYLVGMFAGWLLYKTNCRIRMSVPVVVFGWASCFACLLSLVYGLGSGLGVALSSVYVALGHTAWGASLAWVVVACRSGYGGWVNTLLSYPALYPLSRLTYCAYLVHPLIMFLTSYVMDGAFHIHNGLIVIIYFGNVVASYLLSFLLSLAFEAPIVRLLKLAMTPRRGPQGRD